MRRFSITAATLAAVAMLPAATLAQALAPQSPFLGNYTMGSADTCSRDDYDGLMAVETRSLVRHESRCQFTELSVSGQYAEGSMRCAGEGDEWSEEFLLFLMDSGKLLVTNRDPDSEGPEFTRCPNSSSMQIIEGEVKHGSLDSAVGDFVFMTDSAEGQAIWPNCKMGDMCRVVAETSDTMLTRVVHAERIGAPAVDPCMLPQGTIDRVACAQEQTAEADQRLNAAYRALIDRLPKPRADLLRDTQRKWIAFRDAQCGLSTDTWTVAEVSEANCIAEETDRQADKLEAHLENSR